MDEILTSCAPTGAASSELLKTNAVKLDIISFIILKHLEVVTTQSTPRAALAYIFTPMLAIASIGAIVKSGVQALFMRRLDLGLMVWCR